MQLRGIWLQVKSRLDDGKKIIEMTKSNLIKSLDNLKHGGTKAN